MTTPLDLDKHVEHILLLRCLRRCRADISGRIVAIEEHVRAKHSDTNMAEISRELHGLKIDLFMIDKWISELWTKVNSYKSG